MPDSAPSPDTPHLLVVDDDDRLRALLRRYLVQNGFQVTLAADAVEARRLLEMFQFDLAILDVMMPGENGFELTRDLRRTLALPILLLTARGEIDDRIAGLESGADDYLAKPFEPRELVLRIRTILKRSAGAPPAKSPSPSFGDLVFEPERQALRRADELIRLTQSESALLTIFVERPGETLSRDDLVAAGMSPAQSRAVDVQITRLRRKIEPDPRNPRYLHTVRGRGYMLQPDRPE